MAQTQERLGYSYKINGSFRCITAAQEFFCTGHADSPYFSLTNWDPLFSAEPSVVYRIIVDLVRILIGVFSIRPEVGV
jgi:hypothetical protein